MPRVPWASSVRVGSTLHKLYFDLLLGARVALAAVAPIDLIHAHLHEGAAIGLPIARVRRVPIVFDYQGSLTREMIDHRFLSATSPLVGPLAALERGIERNVDAIVTSSAHGAQLLQETHRSRLPPLTVVPDGITVGALVTESDDRRRARRNTLGIPSDRQVVAYLGLLADYQGVDHLLFAARQVIEVRPNTHFLIMGYPGLEQYRRQAFDLQILDHVTFTGRIPYEEAGLYLGVADIAISAKRSATEANGKLLTYMDAGVPTVAYDSPVAREMLGSLGCYAPMGDITALATSMRALLDNGDRRHMLSGELRNRVRTAFSWDAGAETLEATYREVLRGRGAKEAVRQRPNR